MGIVGLKWIIVGLYKIKWFLWIEWVCNGCSVSVMDKVVLKWI